MGGAGGEAGEVVVGRCQRKPWARNSIRERGVGAGLLRRRGQTRLAEFVMTVKGSRHRRRQGQSVRKTEAIKRMRRGQEFNRLIQKEWCETAEGHDRGLVRTEKGCVKPSGARGRMDVYVGPEKPNSDPTAIVEIKYTDWDVMSVKAVKRNVRRQIRQIWNYIESEVDSGKHPSPGVIFPRRPADRIRRAYIEKAFNDNGIAVVWHDEPSPVDPPDPSLAESFGGNER